TVASATARARTIRRRLTSARALWTRRSSRSSSGWRTALAIVLRTWAREGLRSSLREWRRGDRINRGLYQWWLILGAAARRCQGSGVYPRSGEPVQRLEPPGRLRDRRLPRRARAPDHGDGAAIDPPRPRHHGRAGEAGLRRAPARLVDRQRLPARLCRGDAPCRPPR